jgi:hypothetical protein
MAGILQASTQTYEFSPHDIRMLIAADLEVPFEQVTVVYDIQEISSDPFDRFPGVNHVTKIRVTVNQKI